MHVLLSLSELVWLILVFSLFKVATQLICRALYGHDFCVLLENNLVKPLLKNFVERIFYSEVTCAKLSFCKYPILVPDNDKVYRDRVLKNKPPVERPRVGPNPKILRFVVFADVHIDYQYKEGSETDCGYPLCCRDRGESDNTTDSPATIKRKAGKWGMIGKCDIPPVSLFVSHFKIEHGIQLHQLHCRCAEARFLHMARRQYSARRMAGFGKRTSVANSGHHRKIHGEMSSTRPDVPCSGKSWRIAMWRVWRLQRQASMDSG